MKKASLKHLERRIIAASTAAISIAAFSPSIANADCLGQNDFDNGVGLPWHIECSAPAEQNFNISGGSYNVTILNPGGSSRGGVSRGDCSFAHRNIHIEKNHKYRIHWEVEASCAGELHTEINCAGTDYGADEEDYFEGVWQNNSESWNRGWDNVRINKGKNSFDCEFVAEKTLENAEWVFHYGGAGTYQSMDCFPEGTSLKFDNLTLECDTCGDTFKSRKVTPCLWNPSTDLGIVKPKNNIRLNHLGYYPTSQKNATYAVSEMLSDPVDFFIEDGYGMVVYRGKGKPLGFDKEAGEYCQILDFSELKTPGRYYIFVGDGEGNIGGFANISHEFTIGNDIYDGLLRDAMNYYYQNRSGMDVKKQYITSDTSDNKLYHKAFNEKDEAFVQESWQRSYDKRYNGSKLCNIDVTGGWYTSSNFSKNVITGANAVWLLQNMYERSKVKGMDSKWKDNQSMLIPQEYDVYDSGINGTGTPDVLDEARYELEWMFGMIVDPEKDKIWGDTCADMVYHEVNDHRYCGVYDIDPLSYQNDKEIVRIVRPPTYAATFDMIACAAQASRLWNGIDDAFADTCLEQAEKSWKALFEKRSKWYMVRNSWERDPQFAPDMFYVYSEVYGDTDVMDEAYRAACELFSTTGNKEYYDFLKDYDANGEDNEHKKAFDIRLADENSNSHFNAFDNTSISSMGTLTLMLSDNTPAEDKKVISENIRKAADMLISRENSSANAMGVPYRQFFKDETTGIGEGFCGYEYGSNSLVADNAVIMAYAYDLDRDVKYMNGVTAAMDYLFGRNGLGVSYITGYGPYNVSNPAHRYWKKEIDHSYPKAPAGVMVGGPNSGVEDVYVGGLGIRRGDLAPQKCYVDSVEAWSVNETSPFWQAALVWNVSFLDDEMSGETPVTTTSVTTVTSTAITVTTTSSTHGSAVKYGDANCDGNVDLSDAILIMQALANPDKYGIGGTAEKALTDQGRLNADVDPSVSGLTGDDALRIQLFLINKVSSLYPEA